MIQKAIVKQLLDGDLAEIEVQRQTACGHDCAKCGGCMEVSERIKATALNRAHAEQGDTVTVESDSGTVLGMAMIVYVIPLVLFFALFALGSVLGLGEMPAAGLGALGFAVGIVIAVGYSRHVKRNNKVTFVIVSRG